jgi:hypothetical protein
MWAQLLRGLEQVESWATMPFRRFFEWYAPYFAAYSFPLRRRHEYEADTAAAEAASAEAAARGRTVAPEWRQHYKEAEQARARLTELEGRADALSPEEMKERAHMAAVFRPPEEALPLVRALVEEVPEDAGAHFRLGELLFAQGDERGLVSLDRAMELEPQAILPGCELAFSFLFDKGRAEERMGVDRVPGAKIFDG